MRCALLAIVAGLAAACTSSDVRTSAAQTYRGRRIDAWFARATDADPETALRARIALACASSVSAPYVLDRLHSSDGTDAAAAETILTYMDTATVRTLLPRIGAPYDSTVLSVARMLAQQGNLFQSQCD